MTRAGGYASGPAASDKVVDRQSRLRVFCSLEHDMELLILLKHI